MVFPYSLTTVSSLACAVRQNLLNELLSFQHDNKPKFMFEPDLEMISSDSEDVRAGMQGNIRLLIYHSSFIFLTPQTATSLKQKVTLFKV